MGRSQALATALCTRLHRATAVCSSVLIMLLCARARDLFFLESAAVR